MNLYPDINPVDLYDEYEVYLAVLLLSSSSNFNIIKWWLVQEAVWPSLAKMAFDMLTIPAISAEYERVFSSSKLMIINRKNALKKEAIKMNECLRH